MLSTTALRATTRHRISRCIYFPISNAHLTKASRAYQTDTSSSSNTTPIQLKTINPQNKNDRLVAQRLNRPVSPHITIYKWQYKSLASILHRATGIMLSGSLYGFATLYLVGPSLGLPVDTATVVSAFGSLHPAAKVALKFGVSMPFTYHFFNGLKHLIFDRALFMTRESSARAAWVVLGSSVCASVVLAFWQ
ncbi:hypothetical protein ASPVEDRAFT_887681 [Aspergillus versicolor CBS 583.65]|uniref:Uncharacterized protein n=1 Tax=Aspergillus versicolor CBS 583.65 TaxID=1036611 RepID=A0A1L9PKR8_ASPVE|nr:uncharacterized protein ASPVEDRAFT_887681 [Aspergillus versicolor CBS 583.65]OJJ02072.1 hypothetical protein ASPVEDRAFT_887681 [Aspergillus versicolor CBS 583.65]